MLGLEGAPFYAGGAGADGRAIALDAAHHLEELNRALETSYQRYDQTGGQSMVPESLETSLVSTTFKERHLVIWKDIPKEKAYSTVEEYTTLDDVGTREHAGAGFFVQGGKPMTTDLSANRRFAPIKFMGTERGYTHPMTLVRMQPGPEGLPANNAEAKEVFAGTRWLLRQLERTIPFGDCDVIPTGVDGIERQIIGDDDGRYAHIVSGASNIIDLRGSHLTNEQLEDAATVIENNYGNVEAAKLYLSNRTIRDLGKQLAADGKIRVNLDNLLSHQAMLTMGAPTNGYRSEFGWFPFRPARFLDVEKDTPPSGRTHASAPDAPTLDEDYGGEGSEEGTGYLVDDPGDGESSQFATGDAGDYYYKVTAVNHWGESAPLVIGPISVAKDKVVRISLDQAGGKWTADNDENGCMGYRVYRSSKDGAATTCKYIDMVAAVDCDADRFVDFNHFLPGTSRAFLCDMSPEDAISMRILTPLLKWPLAIIDTRVRFLLLLYLSHIIMYSRLKHVEFLNIGEYSAS